MTQRRIYQNEYPYFITWRTRESYPLFEDEKYAEILSEFIFNGGKLKQFDILAYQIMPDHVHILTFHRTLSSDRTLEKVRWGDWNDICEYKKRTNSKQPERTFSNVRSGKYMRSVPIKNQPTISDLMQSIKGNFSRRLHMGNIWQPRFYTRIVSTETYLNTVIDYVCQNPIKAELPEKYHHAPYQYFDWKKIYNLF
ncbi:transposase [Patescibacteria group bacterium]|nr:transposase [Patescibacteria group bacterium]